MTQLAGLFKLTLYQTACIRSKSVSELNAKNPTILGTIIYSGINPRQFQPFIDGKTIPKQPSEVGTKVPTIYGSSELIGYVTWHCYLSDCT
jgi:hypothetical protein